MRSHPPANGLPAQLPIVEPPKTIAEAVHQMHAASSHMDQCITRLERLAALAEETPEMRTVVINPGNNGSYITSDYADFACKSIGIINPGAVNVFVGVGGVSARPTSRAPVCPGAGALVLPVSATDIDFGCDPTVLLANTAVIYVFRYVTVQPLLIMGNV